jgi:type III restriction enzyme
MTNPLEFKSRLAEAIRLLYDDAPIIGDPDLLDFDDDVRSARGA